jgi:hypothetical protein
MTPEKPTPSRKTLEASVKKRRAENAHVRHVWVNIVESRTARIAHQEAIARTEAKREKEKQRQDAPWENYRRQQDEISRIPSFITLLCLANTLV